MYNEIFYLFILKTIVDGVVVVEALVAYVILKKKMISVVKVLELWDSVE